MRPVDRLLGNELFLRLLSLALAVLIYLQVVGQPTAGNVQRTLVGVPVRAVGLPSALAVRSIRPASVAVTVSGSAKVINELNPLRVLASVDLTEAVAGTAAYYVQVSVPPGVQPLSATPADVQVTAQPIIERESPVDIHVTGTPASGFGVTGPVAPANLVVALRGPASNVDQVNQVVASVSVEGARAAVTSQVTLQAEDRTGAVVADVLVVPASISVTVPVGPVQPQKAVLVDPNLQGIPAPGYRLVSITVTPPAVEVLAPAGTLSGVGSVTTQPVALSGSKGNVEATVLVVEPPGVTAVDPTSVQVTADVARITG